MINPIKVKKPKDLYNWELKLRSKAFQMNEIFELYGKETVKVWEEIKNLELNRLEHVQRGF
jgi:hypothetical protein